jgi:hypothetical protein
MNTYLRHISERREKNLSICSEEAPKRVGQINRFSYYYAAIYRILRFLVDKNKKVLCLRSDLGQYLHCVEPSRGLGVEECSELAEQAARAHPEYEYRVAPFEEFNTDEKFDYILITNGINDFFDVQQTLNNLSSACHPKTRVVIICHNFIWQPLINIIQRLGLKKRQGEQNWLSFVHMRKFFTLTDYQVIREYRYLLLPVWIPLLSPLINNLIATLPLLEKLCFLQGVVVRPVFEQKNQVGDEKSISVIIPCKNERGNVQGAVERIPQMGRHTEIIFCDDKSTDGTAEEVARIQRLYPDKDIKLVEGPGICKAENVWTGFDRAAGNILIILDGDLTVPPEELPKFFNAMVEGKAEFANGTRMIYPMREQSMRLLNIFGNKFFSLLFSHILRSDVSDTLCGTKAIWREDYERMKEFRGSWGVDDRWGDYELIFGAARLNLKMTELPVHYLERAYGDTKMTNRLNNAWRMFRVAMAAYLRLRGLPPEVN